MFCKQCGAEIGEDIKFCPVCGTPVEPVGQPEQPVCAAPEPEQQTQQNTYSDPQNAYANRQNTYYNNQQSNVPPYQNPQGFDRQPQFFDCGIQQRDIAVAIILSIVTCGIYNIYWFIKQVDDVNRAANDQNAFSGGITFLLGLVTCGIYSLYWYYQAGKKISYAQQVRGLPVKDNLEILYLLLGLFGFGIVSMALIQSDLNKMATPNA